MVINQLKTKKGYCLVLFVLAMACTVRGNGQQSIIITPLHHFFKNNFDTTIFFHLPVRGDVNRYNIISRKDNKTYFFKYENPYYKVYFRRYPSEKLSNFFFYQWANIESTEPDTNRNFLPVIVEYTESKLLWNELQSIGIWNITDAVDIYKMDTTLASCCDFGEDEYYFITEKGIKFLRFYNPDFLEDINRKKANSLKDIFNKIFVSK